jgi:hypothetical protein
LAIVVAAPFSSRPVNGPGEDGVNAGPPHVDVPAPIVNSMPPSARNGGGQPATSVEVDVVDVDVVVLVCVVEVTLVVVVEGGATELDDVLDVLVDVVVGRGGHATGAGASLALNLPGSSRVTAPPNVAQ